MSQLALKDLFNNFFVIEEEEEVADRQQPTKNTAQAEPEPQTQATTT
ncbi:cell division protein SepF, partial [Burkholderia multivorans]